ncbi:MAG TPA: cytochrome c-type biogenesis protein CcmH [Candidatus Acidoferrales bacterium]|nr:cytochrome c-type biogenesis protein CcmH [Candidatus Acidoferrales bacterium]
MARKIDRARLAQPLHAALRPVRRSPSGGARDPRAFSRAFLVFAVVLLLLTPATAQRTDRAKMLAHRLLCMCGCNQILAECNHVSCPVSPVMLKKLDAEISSGKSDDLILQSFVQEYGAQVLAEPPAKGFNWVGWLMPFVALSIGLLVVRGVISRWHRPAPAAPAAPSVDPGVLARIREESEEDQE